MQSPLDQNPSSQEGLGWTNKFVKVEASGFFSGTTLRFKLNSKELSELDVETIRLARWNEHESRFRIVHQSGYNKRRNYVFGRITQPGTYTGIGLPRDPTLRAMLYLLNELDAFEDEKTRDRILQSICKVVLRNRPLSLVRRDNALLPELRVIESLRNPECHPGKSLGPGNVAGRITSLSIHPKHGDVVYAGSAGGVFQTSNGGESLQPGPKN